MTPRIDAHQHFWRYSPETHGWIDDSMAVLKRDFLPADLQPLLQQRDFDGCVAVQAQTTIEETSGCLSSCRRASTSSAASSGGSTCARLT